MKLYKITTEIIVAGNSKMAASGFLVRTAKLDHEVLRKESFNECCTNNQEFVDIFWEKKKVFIFREIISSVVSL